MHFGFYYPKFNEYERTYKLSEIQKILDEAGLDINAINEFPYESELIRLEDGIAITKVKGG